MPAEVSIELSTIFGFLLVMARISGVILFVPIPGMQSGPDLARIVLAIALSFLLMPVWPQPVIDSAWLGKLPVWVATEFCFGLLIGVSVSFLVEGVQMAAQMIGLQAGYSFASTIDPTTQADAGVLQIMTQLLAGTLFFVLGLDREIVRVLALSLQHAPPATTLASPAVVEAVVRLGSQIFLVGLRLSLPVLALLILMDISFAILGKVHAQFQLMSLSFPAKMLGGLGMLALTVHMFPKIMEAAASPTFQVLTKLLGR